MHTRLGLVAAALAIATACDSRITGNEGNFQFSYNADDRITDFNKPVAIGASLDLEVRDVGAQQPVALASASFDDPSVLMVQSFADHRITVTGVADGQALLSVEGTTAGGEDLSDSVNLLARTPEVHILGHTCAETDTAAYLVDHTIWVPFEYEMANSQPVIGYGWYPVELSDTSLATLDVAGSNQQWMRLETAATAGDLTLTSDIDGTTLTLDIVTPGELDGVADPVAWVLEDIDVGDVNAFYVLPKVGEATVCQAQTAFAVASDTPAICDVRDRTPETEGDGAREWGWFEIEGVAEGECAFTVTYADGNAGAGLSAQFTYPIEP